MLSCQPASSHSLTVTSSILPLPPAISTSSLQTMREVIGQGDLLQHSDLHQVSVKSFHLITIPPLEAIHPWLDYQPYFRIKYESNIENTILDMSNDKY